MYLVKIDSWGDTLWTRTYGGNANDYATSIVSCGDGKFLLAGDTYSFDPGGADIYILKINSLGDTLWTRTYGGPYHDRINDIIASGDGGYLLAGYNAAFGLPWKMYVVRIDSLGNTLWTRNYGGDHADWANSIVPASEGNFLVAGYTESFGAGNGDMYLVKINAGGDTIWTRTYGGLNRDEALDIIPSGDGGFLLGGSTNSFGAGDYDMCLVKINAQGNELWMHTYGGDSADYASSIIPFGDGGFLLAGGTKSFGSGSYDMLLVKVNANGDTLWTHTYGGIQSDQAQPIISSGDGGFLLGGWTASFGAGGIDMYLVKVEGVDAVLPEPSQIVRTFALFPCHPNPFNPSAVLSYELRAASHVNLKIYDTSGRVVETLVDGWRSPGEHRLTFDGSKLSSGIYLAKLEAGSFTAVQKLVLLK